MFTSKFVDLKEVNIRAVLKLNSSYGRDLLFLHKFSRLTFLFIKFIHMIKSFSFF